MLLVSRAIAKWVDMGAEGWVGYKRNDPGGLVMPYDEVWFLTTVFVCDGVHNFIGPAV